MEIEKSEQEELAVVIRKYCPNEGSRMTHLDSLTEFPDLSGWECPVCGFVLPDEI